MATAEEMRGMSVEELRRRADELRESLFNLRVKHRTGALETTAVLGASRKELARVLTVLGMKAREAASGAAAASGEAR